MGQRLVEGREESKEKVRVVRTSEVYGDPSMDRLGSSIFAQQPNQLKSFQALPQGSYS
jgi:hypothetical protein